MNGKIALTDNVNSSINNKEVQSSCIDKVPLANSHLLQIVKNQAIYASRIKIPILITGEQGTEIRSIAYFIHENKPTTSGNIIFLPSRAKTIEGFKLALEQAIEMARNGTLVLSDVGALTDQCKDFLIYLLANNDLYRRVELNSIQLIITCKDTPQRQTDSVQETFIGCTAHIELHLPPLRQRPEDISFYIEHFSRLYRGKNAFILSEDAKAKLLTYSWPGNVDQLRNIILQLTSLQKPYIRSGDIKGLQLQVLDKSSLIECLYNKKTDNFQKIHPALYKSLTFISHNFLEELSLEKVANHAFSSPSHLSFLFRRELGTSFKSILVELRIFHAKKLIENRPALKITEVCLQSGFGDLSHFEKMFKRYSGNTPRAYRNIHRDKVSLC